LHHILSGENQHCLFIAQLNRFGVYQGLQIALDILLPVLLYNRFEFALPITLR